MNRTILSLSLILSIISMSATAPVRFYHDSLTGLTDKLHQINFPDSNITMQALEIRASLPDVNVGKSDALYGICWNINDSGDKYYRASLCPIKTDYDDVVNNSYILLRIEQLSPYGNTLISKKKYVSDFGLDSDENTLGVEIDYTTNTATIYGGDKHPEILAEISMDSDELQSNTMGIEAIGHANISLAVSEYTLNPISKLQSGLSQSEILERCEKSNPPEGLYKYLDRDNDNRYCRLGGDYRIALLASQRGGYDIIYISGADINSQQWQPGMIKGHLAPTLFVNHFDLEWFDSTLTPITSECSADIEQSAILKLNFPTLKSSVRFSLIPNAN